MARLGDVPPRRRPWDPPDLDPVPDQDRCHWHSGNCAYREDDPARCPFCHGSWWAVRYNGVHVCERSNTWGDKRDVRISIARQMREAVEQGRDPLAVLETIEHAGRPVGLIDLTGQQYGRLTVFEWVEGSNWRCRCRCGGEKVVAAPDLKDGMVRSCGCWARESARRVGALRLIDLTGQQFGRLTVIRRVEDYVSPRGYRKVRWLCRCSCGTEVVVQVGNLRSGRTLSCGCQKREVTSKRSSKQVVRYNGAHARHAKVLGRAKDKTCVDCGGPAAHLSYVGGCPEELIEVGGRHDEVRYCLHAHHYVPRCAKDHKAYDKA